MQQMVMYCYSILSQHVSGIFMPFVASSWSHTYLLFKDARSHEHKVLKNWCYLTSNTP